jgi:chemotaxis protein methyltransferase CheR
MRGKACVALLHWALPRLELNWAGFRKVRGQVCKRVRRRIKHLALDGFAAYRLRLEHDPDEWRRLDRFCRITISRFYRDPDVFERLRRAILPDLAQRAQADKRFVIRCWSAGCASGEEAYTLRILWDLEVALRYPSLDLSVIGTDVDETMLRRARAARYLRSSLRDLPQAFLAQAFERCGEFYRVRAPHRRGITFVQQDLRHETPRGGFDLVLCRNAAFTYFAPDLQHRVVAWMAAALAPGGYLVVGAGEDVPDAASFFEADAASREILLCRRNIATTPQKGLDGADAGT